MTTLPLTSSKTAAAGAFAPRKPGFVATFVEWRTRRAQRRALGQLDAHLLQDIGVARDAALREVDKPFWTA